MLVPASYVTVAGTIALPASRSWKVEDVMLPAFISSLKRAVADVPTLLPAEVGAGVLAEMVGGAVSGVTLRLMSAATSAALRARL